MSHFKLACQTITWGEGQRNDFPTVFQQVARAGYEGVEIGFRHIRETKPADLAAMLRKEGLLLAASHVGGNLFDTQQAGQERSMIDEVLDYLEQTGTKLLMYSGLRYESDEQLAAGIDMLNRAAQKADARGINLLYHNHDFEFASQGKAINALLNDTVDELGWCPDIGWLMKGRADALEFLETIKDRIGAVHFKDFATDGSGEERKVDTVELGEGVAPLDEAAQWLKRNKSGLWIIAEQDRADIPAGEAAARNAAYLKRALEL